MQNRIEELQSRLKATGYIADRALVTTLLLMQDPGRPLLLECEAGVGKTEVARDTLGGWGTT